MSPLSRITPGCKAPVFKGVGKPLIIEDLPDPTPGPGEILLKMGRCGICGTDLHMTDGHEQTYAALMQGHGESLGVKLAGGSRCDWARTCGPAGQPRPTIGNRSC